MVEFSLMLYYKPGPDMGIEGKENFDPEILKKHGEFLKRDLAQIADWLKKLRKAGWSYSGGLYDVICYKDISLKEAKKELRQLGIDINEDNLIDLKEEF